MLYQTLPNGLRTVIIPRPNAPVVSVAVTYNVGSYAEHPTNTGFAHLFEHLMFEGSENVAHGMFDKYCSEAGGENNAYTTFDKTTYYMSLPAHQLELGLWLEADRMAAFGVDEEALTVQKNVVLEEINQNVENSPYGTYSRVLSRTAFAPEAGYSWEVYGEPKHIAASTLDDVRGFFKTFYRPDNACLVVCGAVEPESALPLIEKHFGTIPQGENPVQAKPFHAAYRLGKRHERVEDTIPTDSLFCSYHFDGYTTQEVYLADVLCSVISDGMSSRLYKALAYEERSASDVNAYVDDRRHTSLFTIYAISNGAEYSCEALYGSMWKVLENVLKSGITDHELNKAKNRIKTRIARTVQRASGIADEAAHQALFFDDPARVFRLSDDYTSITADAVHAFAKKLFTRENEIRIDFVPKAA
ncbi:MAG: insulinase family protein [Candidatus Kapabacteria bacterium]|jgi:predicted Zn-dependent peptidase|nr:insulinase family protein [Candidatus Kapabacteria bacterium]